MPRRLLPMMLIAFLITTAIAAQQKVIQLYDGAAPGSETWNWPEAENDNNLWQTKVVFNVAKPTLNVFMPEPGTSNGTAVIICPGGAFYALSITSEGYDVAKWLAKKGVTCFVLKYRLVHVTTNDPTTEVAKVLGKPEFEEKTSKVIPMSIADGKAAIAYVRNHAGEYGLSSTRIGIMGFSAGGTVAASAAFNYTKENRPDFVAPIYAFFPSSMYGTIAADAPPMFIAAASDDGLNLASHSAELYNKWLAAKKSVELHMYAKGGHGFGMKTQHLPTDNWIERFGDWLNLLGYLTKATTN